MAAAEGTLRIGMIGGGWVSRHHLTAWKRLAPRAEVVAIADPDGEALSDRAAEFGIAATYPSAEALLAGEVALDALDICAPRAFHAPLVRLAADRGLPAICQKPLGVNLAEAEQLVADVGDRIRLMVHENWRFRAYYRRLAAWLREGVAGDIRQVRLAFLSSGMIADASGARPALVRQPFLRGLERMLVSEILIHHIDTLRFLLGDLDVRWAWLARSNGEIAGEDVATILFTRRSDGIPVTVTGSLAVHGEPPLPRDRLRIFGTDGTIDLDGSHLSANGRQALSQVFDADAAYQGAYDSVIAHFVECLKIGSAFETGPADNLKTLELVEAVYAANSNR